MNLKDKMEVITGIPSSNQRIFHLESESHDAAVLAQLSDNSKTLSEYGLRDWQVLKVGHLREESFITMTDWTTRSKIPTLQHHLPGS